MVSYKQSFINMLSQLQNSYDQYTEGSIIDIFEELEAALQEDAESCQSLGIETVLTPTTAALAQLKSYEDTEDFKPFALTLIWETKERFEGLNDSLVCAVVEPTSPLSVSLMDGRQENEGVLLYKDKPIW